MSTADLGALPRQTSLRRVSSPDAQAHVTIKVLNALLDLLVRELLDVARELPTTD